MWFSQGKYKFLLTTHYSMPSSMRCGVMMCNGIVFVNFVNQCLLNTSNFLHHTWSHYHDILVRAYCVCSLNEKYAILAYMKSLINLLFTICIKNCYILRKMHIYIIHQLTHYLLDPWVRWDNAISFLSNDKTSLWKPLTIHYIRHNTTKVRH